jgi:hypothetical protein
MMRVFHRIVRRLTAFCLCAAFLCSTEACRGDDATVPKAIPAPFSGRPAFKERGFYLHCGWAFDYPFAPRSWKRADFDNMFEFLRRMGFETVMYWPQIEAIPAPLSESDAAELRNIRDIVGDARGKGLECWFVQVPNLVSPAEIAKKPFIDRNPYRTYQTVRLDDPKQAEAFFAHRTAMLRIVNNADAYVTIDGDPGGYAGAKPEDFLKVFLSDRAAIDAHGADPAHQMVVPWVWAGWGARVPPWQDDPAPFSKAEMSLLKQRLPEPWRMLLGRSHRDGWANGRVNIAAAEELDLIGRSVLLCYEAIEFEPCSPAGVLQFDTIRRNLKEELRLAPNAAGVMGNAQQPIMVLPNLYLFARGSWDPKYLDVSDEQVLRDFAEFLGGPADLLVPAWQCLALPLDRLPKDLPEKLREAKLTSAGAQYLPGGPQRYLEILAVHAAGRIGVLEAINGPAKDDADCARRVADGTAAIVNWWKMHHYVFDGDQPQDFSWRFAYPDHVVKLKDWAVRNAHDKKAVKSSAAWQLTDKKTLNEPEAVAALRALLGDD